MVLISDIAGDPQTVVLVYRDSHVHWGTRDKEAYPANDEFYRF